MSIILITEKDGHADCASTVAYQARVVLAGLIRYWEKKKKVSVRWLRRQEAAAADRRQQGSGTRVEQKAQLLVLNGRLSVIHG